MARAQKAAISGGLLHFSRGGCGAALVFGLGLAVCGPSSGLRAQVDSSDLKLEDGFEEGRFSEKGKLFFKDNSEQRGGRVTFQGDVVHTGKMALKLSLRPSCPPPKPGDGEQAECSERAEIWERPTVLARYDATVWYRFALRLADPIPVGQGRHVLAQWKREIGAGVEHDYSPFLALRLYNGRLGFTVETDQVETFPIGTPDRPSACKPGEAAVSMRPSFKQTRALVAIEENVSVFDYPDQFEACAPAIRVTRHADLPRAGSGWIDFVIRSRPGARGDGHIQVIANGRLVVTVKGAIGHEGPGLGAHQYFKFGPYRAPAATEWSLYYDTFFRASRCEDVTLASECPKG
jgi:hypothetical protein